jgi:hypothetical protein
MATRSKAVDRAKRKILVILTNRWNRSQKATFLELEADNEGNVLKERPLRSQPREPLYDEVWENDEGKTAWSDCNRFRRKFPHPLEKPKAESKG